MTSTDKTSRPLFAALSSVTLLACCLWMVGCDPPTPKPGEDGKEPATEENDHEDEGHEHEGEGEVHGHGDEEKGGDGEEAPTDPGSEVDAEKDDVKAGEPEFPKLPG